MLFLQSHGVTTTYAIKIYKQYGEKSIEVVTDNPYRLAVDVFGIGFRTADKIAMNLGIEPLSIKRAEAGVLYVLGATTDEGHVYYPCELLVEKASQVLEVPSELVLEAICSVAAQELIAAVSTEEMENNEQTAPLNTSTNSEMRNSLIYLRSLYSSETGVVKELKRIEQDVKSEHLFEQPGKEEKEEIDYTKAIDWFEKLNKINLAEQQKDAVYKALSNKLLVITGGPGTGKTTLVNAIIKILAKKERKVMLAAPTGRAAKRMTETTGLEAKTIHRLLEFSPKTFRFERNQENQLNVDLLVIDEMSMVDIVLFYNLLKAVPNEARLILVGDIDQLPSVGPGNVLKDLINSGFLDVVRLKEVFRQAQESMIVTNAHRINTGKTPITKAVKEQSDFYFINREEPEDVLGEIKSLLGGRITKHLACKTEEIQVLAPMHLGLLGATNLNKELQQLLNHSKEEIVRGNRTFKRNDRVMQVRNNYDLDVFNGDIGKIVKIDFEERELAVNFDDRTVVYDFADLDELMLSYACSVHKSQGSEYPVVIIPLHTQHYMMLQRNLLYTAVTRGKKLVIVVGSKKALAIAVKNSKIQERFSLLETRLKLPSLV
jgi:exodeoxyribonuclease V alpha subunit